MALCTKKITWETVWKSHNSFSIMIAVQTNSTKLNGLMCDLELVFSLRQCVSFSKSIMAMKWRFRDMANHLLRLMILLKSTFWIKRRSRLKDIIWLEIISKQIFKEQIKEKDGYRFLLRQVFLMVLKNKSINLGLNQITLLKTSLKPLI